jgi:hypothetical protein
MSKNAKANIFIGLVVVTWFISNSFLPSNVLRMAGFFLAGFLTRSMLHRVEGW